MFHNPVLEEMASKYMMQDRLRQAEQFRLLKRAEAARPPKPVLVARVLSSIRQARTAWRTFVRETATAG